MPGRQHQSIIAFGLAALYSAVTLTLLNPSQGPHAKALLLFALIAQGIHFTRARHVLVLLLALTIFVEQFKFPAEILLLSLIGFALPKATPPREEPNLGYVCLIAFAISVALVLMGPFVAYVKLAPILLMIYLVLCSEHQTTRVLSTAAALPLIALMIESFRIPTHPYFDYKRIYPEPFDAYSKIAKRPSKTGLYRDLEAYSKLGGDFLIHTPLAWLSDGGRRVAPPAIIPLQFVAEWLSEVAPNSSISFLGLISPELCPIREQLRTKIDFFQWEPFHFTPHCGDLVSESLALPSHEHLVFFTPFPWNLTERSKWRELPSTHSSRWFCDFFPFVPPGQANVRPLPSVAQKLVAGVPYSIAFPGAYCVFTGGPDFVRLGIPRKNALIAKTLAESHS